MIPSVGTSNALHLLNLTRTRQLVMSKNEDSVEAKYRVGVSIRIEHVMMNPNDKKFTEEERAVLARLRSTCRFHQLIVHDLTRVFVRAFYPPVGYAAVYSKLTPLDPRCFYSLFHGCAVLWVDHEKGYEDSWATAINRVIPDVSPNPPSFIDGDSINGSWYPSLGRGGWISVCDSLGYEEATRGTAIIVNCSPDVQVQEELHMLLNHLYKSGTSVEATHELTKWFRDYIEENKRRLLYLLVNHVFGGITAPTATVKTSSVLDDDFTGHGMMRSDIDRLTSLGVMNAETLPTSYRMFAPHLKTKPSPSVPNSGFGNHQSPDSQIDSSVNESKDNDPHPPTTIIQETLCTTLDCQPKGIVADLDFIFDDLVPYANDPKHMLRLSNACPLRGKVIRMEGPTYTTMISEIPKKFDTRDFLDAYPALAPPNRACLPSRNRIIITSLAAETNPEIAATLGQNWHGKFPKPTKAKVYDETTCFALSPLFVRYSDLELYPLNPE